MSSPIISIIVPVYKVEPYLRRCLDSIQNQTFKDWECLLIDDGSPDRSGQICDEYAEKDGRFKVIHQENAGVSAARNAGLDAAVGEWIGFVDSDDWIDAKMYEFLYSNAIEKKADVVICGFVGHYAKRIKKMCGTESALTLLFAKKGFGGFSVLRLIAAEKIKNTRFDTSMTYLEDVKFFYEVFKCCDRVYWDNEPLYNYFQREDSVTHRYGLTEDLKKGFVFLDNIIDTEHNLRIRKYVVCSKMNICINVALMYIKNDDLHDNSFLYLKAQIRKYLVKIIFASDFTITRRCFAIAISNPFLSKLLCKYLNR